ncbi:MAG TPA: FapA family protein, partial [Candidatus Kryptobacter bacterium]|nr:FapA family protein [Candidatus Kryptobacter bacterium]
ITGDVKGSGSLKVKHDLFVQGSVEDAKIIAEGSVTVTGSFVGRGDGLIRARGNVAVNVVLNQMVEAGESVIIGKESVNAHLIASDSILATKAIIMGGTVAAGEKIEVHTLGGELYSTTRVKLGLTELLNEDMTAIDKEIELQTKSIDHLKNEVYVLVRDRIDGNNNFTAEKADQLKILQGKLQRQNEYVKELNAKKQETVVEMSRKRSPKLTVLGTIHPSVAAEINGVRLSLKQSYNNVTFEELRNEIIRTKNL